VVINSSFDEMQENQLSDEEYVIYRTKSSQKLDAATAKAWMITAKTLFPRNFAVQVWLFDNYNTTLQHPCSLVYFKFLFIPARSVYHSKICKQS
jgi:integrator complex subunit 10